MKQKFATHLCWGILAGLVTAPLQADTPKGTSLKGASSKDGQKAGSSSMNLKSVVWVQNHQPGAVLVLANEAAPIARYAAEELAHHVKLATGAELPILTETAAANEKRPKVFIGATDAAAKNGIKAEKLPNEECVLRTVGDSFYIVGKDGPGHPVDWENVYSGTLWGVYEVLERELRARWLWPGEGGIVVNQTASLVVKPYDEVLKPRLMSRLVRTYAPWNNGDIVVYDGNMFGQDTGLAFSTTDKLKTFLKDQQIFLRRHRMGMSRTPNYSVGHDFGGWWPEYGEKHPEWFNLIPQSKGEFAGKSPQERARMAYGRPQNTWEGVRGLDKADGAFPVSMCVSNREMHKEIIRRWKEQRAKHPGQDITIGLGENDVWALCVCDECVKLDAAQHTPDEIKNMPGSVGGLHYPFDAGRRYAWFYNEIYKEAVKVDPKVKVLGYIYLNYFVAPKDIKLNPNIILTYVPWGGFYYPRDPREQEWLEDQWMQWRNLGATLVYRPNYILDGGSMPLNYHTQMIDQFGFFLKNGCIGTDFDARLGQWSAQGATMYALLRKHSRPDESAGQLLQEYYDAFGPAARYVKAYFDFWETQATLNSVLLPGVMDRNGATNLLTYARATQELYPQSAFDKAAEILRAAAKTVEGDEVLGKRVRYLELGLTHANKARNLAAVMADKTSTTAQQQAALRDLSQFRRATETLDVANYAQSAADELRSFSDRYDFNTKFDVTVMPADTPMQ